MARTKAPEIETFRSETAMVNGVKLHYWIGGNPQGRPVLLWHGFVGTAYSWHKVMPLLAQAGYSVLVPNMRGYGDSDKPSGTDGYDARALAEEFRTLVKQIGFGSGQKLILASHGMGAHPALLWAADHPDEIACLLYMEVPTMLEEFLTKVIVYTPEAMANGSMWWWILPFAPGVPERLIVGHERAFLTWFYEGATADPASITEASIEETLRSFRGTEGVLGALGVYRAAFTTIEQTTPLKHSKVEVPILAIGGEQALGAKVADMVQSVAKHVTGKVIPGVRSFHSRRTACRVRASTPGFRWKGRWRMTDINRRAVLTLTLMAQVFLLPNFGPPQLLAAHPPMHNRKIRKGEPTCLTQRLNTHPFHPTI